MRRLQEGAAWMMIFPAGLGIVVFVLLPFVISIYFSMTDQRFGSPKAPDFVGAANYERLLSIAPIVLDPLPGEAGEPLTFPRSRDIIKSTPSLKGYTEWFTFDVGEKRVAVLATDPIFMQSLLNNFWFSIAVVPIQCGLALGLAILVNQGFSGSQVFRTIFFSPVVTSMAVISVLWIFLYNPDVGLINRLISWISFGHIAPVNWLGEKSTAMPAILIMSVWQGVGFQMVLFIAGLQGIPRPLYEAASIAGANGFQQFWHVTLPGLRNTTAFVIITTTISSFRLFTQVDVMTQGGPIDHATSTVVFHAIRVGFKGLALGYASAISVVFFLIVVAVTFGIRRLLPAND